MNRINKYRRNKRTRRKVLAARNNRIRCEIVSDKLAEALVKAQGIIEADKKLKEENNKKAFRGKLGVKDYSDEKSSFIKCLKTAGNKFCVFFNVLFIRKNILESADPALAFAQTTAGFVLGCAQFGCYIFCALVVATLFYHPGTDALYIWHYVIIALFFIASFFLAQIFRMMKIQVENMRDREYLFAIIGAVVSIASLIISIISCFR